MLQSTLLQLQQGTKIGGGGGNRTRVRRTYDLNYYTVSQLLNLTGLLCL
jgi:hypothetical protein